MLTRIIANYFGRGALAVWSEKDSLPQTQVSGGLLQLLLLFLLRWELVSS